MPVSYKGKPVQIGDVADVEMDVHRPRTYRQFLHKFRNVIGTKYGHSIPVISSESTDIVVVGPSAGNQKVLFAIT